MDGRDIASIGRGLAVLVGIAKDDDRNDARWLAQKVADLRLFDEGGARWAKDAKEANAEVLLVSNFTVAGDASKGRRPSFDGAAPTDAALVIFEHVERELVQAGVRVHVGEFGADMQVSLANDGPVTLVLDSKKRLTNEAA